MMKSKGETEHEEGLLEFLEDIIGSNQYIEPIEEHYKRLETLNDDRNSKQQKLKHVERARDKLADEKAEAEEYLRKERELLEWRSTLFQLFVRNAKQAHAQAHTERQQTRSELNEEYKKHQERQDALKKTYETYKACSDERKQVQSQLEHAQQQFQEYERSDIKQKEERKHTKQKAKAAEEKAASEENRAVELEQESERLQQDVPKLEQERSELEQQLEEEQCKLDQLVANTQDESAHFGNQLNEVMKQLEPWEVAISEAQARVESLQSERRMIVDRMQENDRLLNNAREGKSSAEERVKGIKGEMKEAEQNVNSQRQAEQEAQSRQRKAEEEVEWLRSKSSELQGQVEQAKTAMQEEQSKSAAVRAINDAKRRKNIKGVHGRLGDLGVIESKYDVAVSTAAGAQLDYIVVDDAESAQQCVQLLRDRNLGVATMLILEKQQHLEEEVAKQESPPENTVRLYDLVKCSDEKLHKAFFYALGNTVVTQDIESASNVAYHSTNKRFKRVVTLDGKLFESTGTMSGGGSQPRGGKMRVGSSAPKGGSSSSRARGADSDADAGADDVNELERQLSEINKQLEDARKRAESAKQEAEVASCEGEKVQSSIEKLKQELASRTQQISDLESRISDLEQSSSADNTEEDERMLRTTDEYLEQASSLLEQKQNGASDLKAKAQELRDALENVGGQKMKDTRAKVDSLSNQISEAKNESARKEGQAKSKAQAAERARAEAKQQGEERDRLNDEFGRFNDALRRIEEEAGAVLERYNEAEQMHSQKEKDEKKAREEYEQLQKEMQDAKGAEFEIQSRLEEKEKAAKESEDELRKWERKLAKVNNERASDDERSDLTEDELQQYDPDDVQAKVTYLDASLSEQRPDMSTIEEYNKKRLEYDEKAEELRKVVEERDSVRSEYERLRKARLDEFMRGFNAISLKLKEMYQMITLGGDAELELVDSLDPFSEGIVFSVRPPKKSWKNISNLSGGERTLSSLALVFALHHHKPTPLYVMDEIDAALDFKNVSIVGHYIKERTRDAQFIIISLRNNMFELSDRLHGIYKTNHQTKTVTIDPAAFALPHEQRQQPQPDGQRSDEGNYTEREAGDDATDGRRSLHPALVEAAS
jgi:structural maintenance of chromosome 4